MSAGELELVNNYGETVEGTLIFMSDWMSLLLIALNANDEKSTFQAFRDDFPTGSVEKTFTDEQLSKLLNKLKEKHAPIKQSLASGVGVYLMNLDAQICEHVIRDCTEQEIPVLAIHDSFIVPFSKESSLTAFMFDALDKETKNQLHPNNKRKSRLSGTMPEDRQANKSSRYTQQYKKFQSWLRN